MKKIISTDGTPIALERTGAGPPLVLVHGTSGDHTRWGPVLPMLEQHFTVYAMDRRGRGQSGDGELYSIDREFEDVAAVVDWIDEPANLVGHSYGALCCLEVALRTTNLRRLVLYEPPIRTELSQPYSPEAMAKLNELIEEDDREGALLVFMAQIAEIPLDEIELLKSLPGWSARLAAAHTITREQDALGSYAFDPTWFMAMGAPTLLLLGGDSPWFYQAAAHIVDAALPNSRVVVMPGQGHAAIETAPDLLAREIVEFLMEEERMEAGSTQKNKDVVTRLFDLVYNKGDMDVMDELCADMFRNHNAPAGVPPGAAGFKHIIRMVHSAFPDWDETIEAMVAEGDKVAVRSVVRATHEGEYMGMRATGKRVNFTRMSFFRIAGGRIVDRWSNEDDLGLLSQLGVAGRMRRRAA